MRANGAVRLASRAIAAVALVSTLFEGPLFAQSGASTGLTGQVTDSTGSAIPGVTVTLTHIDTGRERVVTSGSDGNWEARFLSPGMYPVTFELGGFRPLRREGVAVSTAEMATVDALLQVGGVAEAVEVVMKSSCGGSSVTCSIMRFGTPGQEASFT